MAYTNSSLVNFTMISPNKNSPRNHSIDRITPHCYVGQANVESMANWLCNPIAQASCNYCIGRDGRIGMLVEEKDRSWCSSSADNDNRAITIECASDLEHPYAVNDTVYNKLIELMVDICKRNGKNVLLWIADKDKSLSYTPKSNEMLITVHRWFANKACPGDYIYGRLGQIADSVNKKLGSKVPSTVTKPTPTTTPKGNAEIIWDYFKSKELNNYAVAGLLGNLRAESALSPINMQDSYEQCLDYNDASYTKAVDDGSYTNFYYDSCGYGLAQWTFWTRKKALLEYAQSKKVSIGDLQMQLDFLWQELQGYRTVMIELKNAKSVKEASNTVLLKYEAPADVSEAVQNLRASYGQEYYDQFAKSETSTSTKPAVTLYRVQVGAFTEKANADAKKEEIISRGFPAIVKHMGDMYKVQAGAYKVKRNAENTLKQLHNLGYTDAFITT